MPTQRFLQFSQLPPELRYKIWGVFGLPRGPMLHTLSSEQCPNVTIMTSMVYDKAYNDLDHQIDLTSLCTIRALMQVSREAREIVLAGRHMQRTTTHKTEIKGFMGGVTDPCEGPEPYCVFHTFFFVNWDIDMFYFRFVLWPEMDYLFDAVSRESIRHIAIDVNGPEIINGTLTAPRYCDFMMGFRRYLRDFFKSVETIYLVIGLVPLHRMGAHNGALHKLVGDPENDKPSGAYGYDTVAGFDDEYRLYYERNPSIMFADENSY
ncbi:hypothetical protein F5Y08DRAFT_340459 [Xylaria arbuscula]|nr:hypothetical protein F5Y08DRAFT_340459 [Xylaria arbuscula]